MNSVTRDERVQVIRWRSMEWGFAAMMSTCVIFTLLAAMLPLSVDFTAMFTVGIGIAFSIGRFVHLNR